MSAEINQIIIPLYIDSAQVYLQISGAAIGFSIAFKEKILGEGNKKSVSFLLILSWLSFLLAIGFSVFYQYLAVKFLDTELDASVVPKYFSGLVYAPGRIYGAMMITFFVGSFLLVISSAIELRKAKVTKK